MKNYSEKVLQNALFDLRKTLDFIIKNGHKDEAEKVRVEIKNLKNDIRSLKTKKQNYINNDLVLFMRKNFMTVTDIANFYGCSREEIEVIWGSKKSPHKNSNSYLLFLKQRKRLIEKEIIEKEIKSKNIAKAISIYHKNKSVNS